MGAWEKHHLPIGNDCFSRGDTLINQHFVLDGANYRHYTRLHGFILLHDVDKLSLLAGLYGMSRYDGRVLGYS